MDNAFGQRPGLVGAKHIHAPEILDRVEPANQYPSPRHHPRPAGQVDAQDRGEQFRAQSHREGQREEQSFDGRAPT